MSKTNNLTDFLTDTANAIRAKKGTTAKINPQNFASEIADIQTGNASFYKTFLSDGDSYTIELPAKQKIAFFEARPDTDVVNARVEFVDTTGNSIKSVTLSVDRDSDYPCQFSLSFFPESGNGGGVYYVFPSGFESGYISGINSIDIFYSGASSDTGTLYITEVW